METYQLVNGQTIPKIGFGTWQLEDGEPVIQAVKNALNAGYRHIDTAQTYGNEAGVGQAIQASDVPREEIFLTTKIWNDKGTYEDTLASFEESLNKLQTNYVDLLLIHWPNPKPFRQEPGFEVRNREVWRALETLYKEGKAKAIGVSNFLEKHLEPLFQTAEIKPMVNQIKLAPGLSQDELVAYCRDHDILVEAYSPLGSGQIFDNQELQAIADKHDRSLAQIALAWSLAHDFLPLPRSKTPKHILSNYEVFDIDLTPEEVRQIDQIKDLTEAPDPDTKDF
ncbi:MULTISPECIES: aldo/keto reductase [Aerococcus]|uniref:Aldo/keto reductase n=1 Tax=Aerococcus sanguinicola TaxID=119206 RepID=A0A5N1GHV7_9LACT|nr:MULTISPECIES: aldo/keto reductase [Aerococcus]KAA9300537.1 aldo/keto reductase [Aerococcus sanguinicola]MDK6370159.1 aldo/keto reductase [Aerococcus sp. UMB9870]MDK6680283.1 aldo/keto reductase [Aerococcus sp. UMB8608]MDK6686863.1 aldo/keto reductase [Aerococcus sp. UMB8623]MDK6939974.1 aldo/keto reductase [Aerococcus sp. UMB8487]